MPKVSIVLPVYNVAQYIGKCTESLLNQTLDDLEVFFVDDHGPDNSMQIAKQLVEGHRRAAEFHFIETPEYGGWYGAQFCHREMYGRIYCLC